MYNHNRMGAASFMGVRLYDKMYLADLNEYSSLQPDWDRINNKTILITGASGMIGTFMIDLIMHHNQYFNQNTRIIALSRNEEYAWKRFGSYRNNKNFCLIAADVNQALELDEECQYIIHAASNTHPRQYSLDPIGTITSNVIGLKNVLDYACKAETERVVFLSSVEIYGENKGDIDLFSEDYCGYIDSNTLRAGYPESKRVGEALCQAYIESEHLDIVIPRLSRVYGPTMRSDDTKAISQFINKAVCRQDIVLKSDGHQLYSYCYVADAVSAILYIMMNGKCGEAYNVASDNSDLRLKDIVDILSDQVNTSVVYELPDIVEQKGYTKANKAIMDIGLLKSLGWKSHYDMKRGLKATVDILTGLHMK